MGKVIEYPQATTPANNDVLFLDGDQGPRNITYENLEKSVQKELRDLITDLTARLNALADSDDITLDQLSEIVAYIKANRDLIDSITTSKVSVSSIVDDLITTATDKPLSANQGKILREKIEEVASQIPSSDSTIIVDSAMSDTSENPVQNKIVKGYIDGKSADINGKITEINSNIIAMESLPTTASPGIKNYSVIRRYGNLYVLQILIAAQSSGTGGDVLLTLPVTPISFSAAPLVPYDDGSTAGSVQITVRGKDVIANGAYKNKTYQGTAFFFV